MGHLQEGMKRQVKIKEAVYSMLMDNEFKMQAWVLGAHQHGASRSMEEAEEAESWSL